MNLMRRWTEIRHYVRFEERAEDTLRALAPIVRPHFQRIIDLFYDRIFESEGARRVFTGGDEQIARQKRSLGDWLEGCFAGPWDGAYFEKRAKIGRVHVWIGLEPRYMVVAMDLIRRELCGAVDAALAADGERVRAGRDAVTQICDLDLAVMLETYREEFEAQLMRRERLATFGQLMASIGHELRNPLGVIESSLYMVRSKVPQEEKILRHLDRIEEQVGRSNRIITSFLDLVRERPRKVARAPVAELIETAVAAVPWPPQVRRVLEVPPGLPDAAVDVDQARQILVNLLLNATEAVGASGEVRVGARVEGREVAIVVNDGGPGIAPEVRARLFEPLVSTRLRGTGLGLALCKRLAEANGGSIRLVAGPLPGAAFEVRFPAARSEP
jgi:signal transduction histidine kinase